MSFSQMKQTESRLGICGFVFMAQTLASKDHGQRQDTIPTAPNSQPLPRLTPDFSSKILIPPKDTVRKTFCLCSPLDRAEAAIPCRQEDENRNMRKDEMKIKQKQSRERQLSLLAAILGEHQLLCKDIDSFSPCFQPFLAWRF